MGGVYSSNGSMGHGDRRDLLEHQTGRLNRLEQQLQESQAKVKLYQEESQAKVKLYLEESQAKVKLYQEESQAKVKLYLEESQAADSCPDKIDRQLKETRAELSEQKPLITENIIEELALREDSMVLRYSELKDRNKIAEHITEIFKDENAVKFLMDAAEKMIAVFQDSDEMKELQRWNQVKKVIKCGDSTVGMELHYKVVITEEKVGALSYVGRGKTDTVVILGYKFIQHVLDVDPAIVPDDEKLKALRF